MKLSGSSKKIGNPLVAAGAAAVLAVYSAGYARTRSAADQLEEKSEQRRPAPADAQRRTTPVTEARLEAPVPALAATPAAPAPNTPAPVVAPRQAAAPTESATTSAFAPPQPAPAAPAASTSAFAPEPVVEHKVEVQTVTTPPPPPAPVWKDGTYTGWGTSRHGDIQAQVIIEGGKIASATIADCRTRYSCDVIDKLPPQVAKRQSPDVDYVSGATQSANAFYYGVVDALSKAK